MSSVLPTPSAGSAYRGPVRWPLSVEAYHGLGELGLIPERTELLYGQVFPKMPKSPLHRLLVLRLLRWLRASLPADCFLQSEQPLTFVDSEPEPDVSVVRGSEEDFPRSHPTTAELVVEVCVSSHDYDRDKLRAYAGAGVREVWLVLGPERELERFHQPEEGRYAERTVFSADAILTSTALPGVRIPLAELFRI
ncbi:MAG: Uma2 family endonuclease [Verrucomicrobia bacterium]|nr:Uma2 family endonuclease [Verrucomicrobiota bacterium]